MRNLVGLTLVGVLLVSALLLIKHARNTAFEIDTQSDMSIIRLHDQNGRFFCSGVVISPHMLATAAHCVSQDTPFGTLVDPDMVIEVRSDDMRKSRVAAHIKSLNSRMDVALLVGDFADFAKRDIIDDPAQIDAIMMDPASKLVTCGYPLGGPLTCSRVTEVRHGFYTMYYAQGWMYPGMSGGPVIDLRTGAVLAVNRGIVDTGEIIFNPLADFFDLLLPPKG